MIGTVAAWIPDRGFGFVNVAGTLKSVFCHVSDVAGLEAGDPPAVGDTLEFDVIDTPRGPRARDVKILKRVD